ncbi:hypothetical protein [Priestia megaterium]|uniref:hypothetical protein n=1 Tax=Priestia megaterium TaxID=1404 RepID=UPI0020415684|nr:hypothetical protein [Priestia megaterium]MCM3308585.1 hypothetical protein [Priestia megaterium]
MAHGILRAIIESTNIDFPGFPNLGFCEGSACATLSTLPIGTNVGVYTITGNFFSGKLVGFDSNTCSVTLRETLTLTPLTEVNRVLDCTKIEVVEYTPPIV